MKNDKEHNKNNTQESIAKLVGYKSHHEGMTENERNSYYKETSTIIDANTGEVKLTNYKTINREREGDFIKLYLKDVCCLHDMQGSQHDILYNLLKHMTYQNLIIINKALKDIVANEIGIKTQTVSNAITAYVKKGILIRKDRGLYIANPYLFGKGKFEDIQKIRTKLEYTSDGIKMSSQIDKKELNNEDK